MARKKDQLLILQEIVPKIVKNVWEMELEQSFLRIITGNSKLLKDSIFSPHQPFPYPDIPNFYESLKGPN